MRNNRFLANVSGTNRPFEYFIVTERSKTGTFTGTSYNYKINWVGYWLNSHSNPALFRTEAEQALEFNWDKQITAWDLCNGVINNQPLDDNNEFDLNIDGYGQMSFPYRGCNSSNATQATGGRNIFIDYGSYQTSTYSGYSNEDAALHSITAHEFFDNIQYSHNQMNYNTVNEMKWLLEGQAKFIETVFMQDPACNTTVPGGNAAFINKSFGSYGYFSDLFLDNNYNTYAYPSINDVSYKYGIFWRHLWEQNYSTSITEANKMALIRETMKANTSSVLTDIETNIMDAKLSAAGGRYSTFDAALKDFSEKTYFH